MKYTIAHCSCIICHKEYSVKGIHSHFLAAHTKEGNDRVRKNGNEQSLKIKTISQNLAIKHLENYKENPKKCYGCNVILKYDKRFNKFCTRSCSNKHTNENRIIKETTKEKIRTGVNKYFFDNPPVKNFTPISVCINCNRYFVGRRKTCSQECLSKAHSNRAYRDKLGHNGIRNGKSLKRLDSYDREVRLESSYEIKFAELLDELFIKWTRPLYFCWTDANDISHRYYPDFYLPEHDLYYDTKNDYLIKKDFDKINRVNLQNNIIVNIVSFKSINKDYIISSINNTII